MLIGRPVRWNTDSDASETIHKAGSLDEAIHVGDTLRDIDPPNDLAACC